MNLGIGLAIGGDLNNPLVPALALATGNSNQLGNSLFDFGSNSITSYFLGGYNISQPGERSTSVRPDFLGRYTISQPGQFSTSNNPGFGLGIPSIELTFAELPSVELPSIGYSSWL